jgi:hypothetical protein
VSRDLKTAPVNSALVHFNREDFGGVVYSRSRFEVEALGSRRHFVEFGAL